MTTISFNISDSKLEHVLAFLKKEGAEIVNQKTKQSLKGIAEEVDDELGQMALKGMETPGIDKEAFLKTLKKNAGSH